MKVNGSQSLVNTYAFLDEGSDLTLIENDLVKQLGVRGSSQSLCLHWTGNTSRVELDSTKVDIDISGVGQAKRFKMLNARTVTSLDLPRQSFNAEHAVKQHEYLRGLPLNSYCDVKPMKLTYCAASSGTVRQER